MGYRVSGGGFGFVDRGGKRVRLWLREEADGGSRDGSGFVAHGLGGSGRIVGDLRPGPLGGLVRWDDWGGWGASYWDGDQAVRQPVRKLIIQRELDNGRWYQYVPEHLWREGGARPRITERENCTAFRWQE